MNQIAESNEAMAKEIDGLCYRFPFLIDSSAPEVQLWAKHATEIGVADRAIHNSINALSLMRSHVKESGLNSAIILIFTAIEKGTKGKMDMMKKQAAPKATMEYKSECGITRPLIDTAAMPLGAGSKPIAPVRR